MTQQTEQLPMPSLPPGYRLVMENELIPDEHLTLINGEWIDGKHQLAGRIWRSTWYVPTAVVSVEKSELEVHLATHYENGYDYGYEEGTYVFIDNDQQLLLVSPTPIKDVWQVMLDPQSGQDFWPWDIRHSRQLDKLVGAILCRSEP
jgi:hypothetical protein